MGLRQRGFTEELYRDDKALPYEFSEQFEGPLRLWMREGFRDWDIQHRREMVYTTSRRIAESKPLWFTEEEDFTVNNPFGHDFSIALNQMPIEYRLSSGFHWALLAEASILVPQLSKPIHPLAFPYSQARLNNKNFPFIQYDVNRIAKQARANLVNLPNRRERMLELYLQGFTYEEIGEIFGVSRQRAVQILDGPIYTNLVLTPEEKYIHQVMQEKTSILKLKAMDKRGVDISYNSRKPGIIARLHARQRLGSYYTTKTVV